MQFRNYLRAVIYYTAGKSKNCLKAIVRKQALRIMKLTAILITIVFLQVKAEGFSQTITYSGNDLMLEKVFTVIKQQTGYVFLYTTEIIKDAKKVSLHVKDATLEDVLEHVLKDQQLGYLIENKTIVITRKRGLVEKRQINQVDKAPPGEVTGKVMNHKGEPLAGANVKVIGTVIGGITNVKGDFVLRGVEENATIEISYLGFETQIVRLEGQASITVQLKLVESELAAVSVSVYTGYQQIPKERATGSFIQIDNKLLNRSASLDVLSRLEGVASGVAFYRNSKSDQPVINIRGRSTIFANAQPLIILDNFPYDGDITNINPNSIETITILRDAAAGSIYGVRSANGVIVITTKKGTVNQPVQAHLNTNITIGAKPDLHYFPLMSSDDFIEAEKIFFSKGWYTAQENSVLKSPLTPAVELLIKKRDGLITAAEADQQIEDLKRYNVLDQAEKYFLRNSVLSQNALSLSGGGNKSRYFLALSFDKDQSSFERNSFNRFSVNATNSFTPFRNIDINTGLIYTNTRFVNNNPGINEFISVYGRKFYPYAQLADENGYALPVNFGYRDTYKSLKESQGFLDWQYRPLDELNLADNTTQQQYNRVNLEIRKTFSSNFNIELKYQYEKQLRKGDNLMVQETYFTRNLINQYYNPTGTIKYPVPLGGILDQTDAELEGHTGRAQVNFNETWQKHRVNVIGGFEVKQQETKSNQSRLYGYSDDVIVSQPVDYVTRFPTNPNGALAPVLYPRTVSNLMDRYLSYYANASYSYNDRYIVSASGRFDNTNFFGIESNQRVVPLWSTGVKWNISREAFFQSALFDQLAVRATYGYNGNISKDLTAYTTVRYGTDVLTRATMATVVNPPNPELRWEKISMVNLGVVFALKKNLLSGTIEYFTKKGDDLIGDVVMDPTTGITSFRGNVSNIKGKGLDVQLTGKILNGQLAWNTNVLFSYAIDKVTNYTKAFSAAALIQGGSGDASSFTPFIGHPVLSIYSYAWGGLDPTNGDPLGVVEGLKTNDYSAVLNNTTPAGLIYNGPVNPPIVGAFRNDFLWNNFSVSVNITCKLGHYFRRPSIDYGQLLHYWAGNKDFAERWQKPGDEAFTNVPSIPAQLPTINSVREFRFYANTDILAQKADHVRLQDIVIGYDIDKEKWTRLIVKKIHVYCNINNIGILWRANKYGIDPDAVPYTEARVLPQARSMTLGARFDF
ncbi:SusC/RagA family TonB-linked outer membrane protein [Niastella caeni]|uniref:SusC/RagA family TonB-linked outer membrane protein n=1 Tax=Niastella caeni TaxID=2569763 RepID=A0A4S8HZL3_9BACT|nr:SusC/RagA family TonB-linked outer membrane protein [Niastella caeni]THU40289.1 SusC/RagA family TonB-linked outer membrane protein [Niastella caeni]